MDTGQVGSWWRFSTASSITFGEHTSRFLPDACRGLGNRVLLLTDQNLAAAGVVGPLESLLRDAGDFELLIYDKGETEIGFAGAERCAAAVREFAPSVVVGLGGGSNLDLAKVVATRLLTNRRVDSWVAGGVPGAALPVIALPTTAGTGSEVTSLAVLTDERHQTKVGLASRGFLPSVVLVDPVLTLSCPQQVTAHSGMDALTHAIEAYMAREYHKRVTPPFTAEGFVGKNPVSDALALSAISLIGGNLRRAVANGGDFVAREAMALASLLAGMAFSSAGTAIVHALQYPVGARTKTPHGLGNAILLPAVVRYNLPVRQCEATAVARALGFTAGEDIEAAKTLPSLLSQLASSIGITPGLDSIGVVEADLPEMAVAAARITRLTDNNPRPVDADALLEVLHDALHDGPLGSRRV